jgi:superfamily II DNA or RNA helicase
MQISQSDVVRLRHARWRVLDIRGYDGCQIILVAGADPRNAGTERRFMLPFDDVEPVDRPVQPVRVSRRQWRCACLRLLAAETPPGGLVAARDARIDLLPHQLEPALAVVRGLGSRVLLADDVGLGKTVQAGLIVAELRGRGAADRVLIVTPAGLRDQWAHELSERFGLRAEVLDVRALRQRSASLPLGMNPWESVPLAIVSIDYLKRAEVLSAAVASRWDVVVVDEAHGVAADSERHAAIAALASRTPYVVLASATPHNGNRRDFVSLCGLGDTGDGHLLLFRRSRHDVHVGGRRRVHHLHVRMNRGEASMHALLLRFSRIVRAQRRSHPQGPACWLALSVLHKRALSSSRSLQLSVERRLAALASVGGQTSQLPLPLDDSAGEFIATDEAPVWPATIALDDPDEERRLLGAILETASRASQHETKIDALKRLLRRVNERAIVFTEYRDTLRHVRHELGLPCLTLHGGMNRHERQAEIERFTSGRGRLLLATDAAAEGLNLQQQCRLIINLELPWNPMRLEQRIGRVDRIGQRRPVHVWHLIARDSAEGQILARLRTRIATARVDIGGSDPLSSDPSPSSVAPPLRTPTLAHEAGVETARIAGARAFAGAAERKSAAPAAPDAPLIVRTRRWRTRTVLAGRRLMLWRLVAEDGCGGLIGSRLVAMAIARGSDVSLVQLKTSAMEAAADWRAQMEAVQQAFTDTRLARHSALQRVRHAGSRPTGTAFQPGLFERRLDRARLAVEAGEQAVSGDLVARLQILRRSRVVKFRPPQLQLVLLP